MNWLNWLIGRKVVLMGCIRNDGSFPIPAVYLGIRHWWFNTTTDIMDCISFLVVAENIASYVEYDKDFVYNKMHENTKYSIHIPAWAFETVQRRCAIVAPLVYDGLKKRDEENLELAKEMGEGWEERVKEWSAMDKYQKLRAQVNGYTLEGKDDKKVLH